MLVHENTSGIQKHTRVYSELSQYSAPQVEDRIRPKSQLTDHNQQMDVAQLVEEDMPDRAEKEFSFFRNELVPSPLKADADFMHSNDGNSHIRNTSESAISNNLPCQINSGIKRGDP